MEVVVDVVSRASSMIRIAVIVGWAVLWTVVLVFDPSLGYLVEHPFALAAITVLPQLALGYAVGSRAILFVLPLALAWALVAHGDCVTTNSTGGECGVTASGFVGLAGGWALIWGCLVAAGYGLRVGVARWTSHRSI